MVNRQVRIVAAVWQIAYALVHMSWATSGGPRFLNGRESYFPGEFCSSGAGSIAFAGYGWALCIAAISYQIRTRPSCA